MLTFALFSYHIILSHSKLISWHIRGDVGRRSVTDSVARVAETPALGRRSWVRGSVVGPFSHVAILLNCVVSSEFKKLISCFSSWEVASNLHRLAGKLQTQETITHHK